MDEMTYPMPSNEERLEYLDDPRVIYWHEPELEEADEEYPLHTPLREDDT